MLSPNGHRLLVDAAVQKPDVIVLDVSMPELNGIDAAVQLQTSSQDQAGIRNPADRCSISSRRVSSWRNRICGETISNGGVAYRDQTSPDGAGSI
jgi:hypothetical protein